MTKRALVASGYVSLLALAGCSSDASGPATGNGGTSGVGGSALAGGGAGGGAGSAASAGSSGTGVSGGGSGGASAGSGGMGGLGGASAGSGGSTAGGGGSTGVNGGAGGGSASCAYEFCADFEGAAPGTAASDWKIDVDKKGSVVEAVTSKAHGGTHSVHVKISEMAGVFGYITETKSLAATGASFWGRVFIWSEVATPAGHIVNVAIDGKSGTTDEQVRIFNVINGKIAINRRSDDKGAVSNVAPTMGKWQCYEWHITPNTLDVYLDSTKLPISQTWDEPTISLLRMGFERFTAGSAGELWLDDVAINDAQIGCN